MAKKNNIILVDKRNRLAGFGNKETVHKEGILHRAFSIFILNKNNELLLQQRSKSKYHSAGLWTNTCCSHPMPRETTINAARRRLWEEMGFKCKLKNIFSFIYKTRFENKLFENEFDYVYLGYYDGKIFPDKKEVHDYKWTDLNLLRKDILKNPNLYTVWFKICFEKFLKHTKSKKNRN